jgi:hypothetical protein
MQFTTSMLHGLLACRPDLIRDPCQLYLEIRDASQSLNVGVVQPTILDFLISCTSEVLRRLKVLEEWTQAF